MFLGKGNEAMNCKNCGYKLDGACVREERAHAWLEVQGRHSNRRESGEVVGKVLRSFRTRAIERETGVLVCVDVGREAKEESNGEVSGKFPWDLPVGPLQILDFLR